MHTTTADVMALLLSTPNLVGAACSIGDTSKVFHAAHGKTADAKAAQADCISICRRYGAREMCT